MTKTELLNRITQDKDERVMLAKVLDRQQRSKGRSNPEHTMFLSPADKGSVELLFSLTCDVKHLFTGGYETAERCVCIFLPDWMDESFYWDNEKSPVTAIMTELRADANLNHRDVLGSLMGLGITREKIGDILLENGKCQVLLLREVLGIILSQWETVGRYKISAHEIALSEVEVKPPEIREIRDTVAALRLDCVVASGFSLSRAQATALIVSGRVRLNHRGIIKADKLINPGDTISCRGHGKCRLREVLGKSRKDRIIIVIDLYV